MSASAAGAKEVLNIDVIRQQLATHTVGRRIILHEVVESTNASLRQLADAGARSPPAAGRGGRRT